MSCNEQQSVDLTSLSDDMVLDEFLETIGLRVLFALRRIIRAVDIHSRKLNSEFNITVPQMICLYSLTSDGSMTLSELTKQANLSASTVNGIVDRLEAKGLTKRNRSTEDRRRVFVNVTDAGRELTRAVPSPLQTQFAEALRNLPELEQATIVLSLERVVKLMEAEDLDASPNIVSEVKICGNNGENKNELIT